MADSKAFRIGVIGAGWAADGHIAGFNMDPRAQVVGVANRTRERAEATAQKHGIPHVVGSHTELLTLDLDAVAITTPGKYHYEAAMDAFKAGCHVICEKPMAMNAQEAYEMQRAGKERGLAGAMAFTWRYPARFQRMRALIAEGNIGRVQEVHAHCMSPMGKISVDGWMSRLEEGGGLLYQLASHEIDRVRALIGREAERVCGREKRVVTKAAVDPKTRYFLEMMRWRPDKPIDEYEMVEATADTGYDIIADFEEETAAVFRSGKGRGENGRVIEAYGDEGTLILREHELVRSPYGERKFERIEVPEAFRESTAHLPYLHRLWAELIAEFIDLMEGKESGVPTLWDGYKGMQIIDAARISGAEERWVHIKS